MCQQHVGTTYHAQDHEHIILAKAPDNDGARVHAQAKGHQRQGVKSDTEAEDAWDVALARPGRVENQGLVGG